MKMDDRLSAALTSLPKFSAIAASEIVPTISRLLDDNRAAIDALLDDSMVASWAGVVAPLEAINDRLNRTWSPIGHLHNVADNDALRSA